MDKDKQVNDLHADYEEQYGFSDSTSYIDEKLRGLTPEVIKKISGIKNEPQWMLDFRLNAYEIFRKLPNPDWAHPELFDRIDFDSLVYYARASEKQYGDWDEVPEEIKETFEKLGVPEAERKFLAGVSAQYESEVVYHQMRDELKKQGVIFLDIDSGLREYPDLFREYFASIVPPDDNKFAALNSAVWSGGSFIYVPEGVKLAIPLQAYFRINAENIGQFERTIIIVDKNASVHYIEGCTAPVYSVDSFHSGVIELFAMEGAKLRYTTIQNWSKNVYNLVTQRSVAYKNALVEWVDGNMGSKFTMKYPTVILKEPGAKGRTLSIAYAGKGQHQDAGAKMIHLAPNTSSRITSKSISKNGGRSSYRGLVKVLNNAHEVKSSVVCDALLMDDHSRSDTYPTIEVREKEGANISHEARVGKISDETIYYLRSRGLTEDEAVLMVVNGFLDEFKRELPMEYAVEFNRLVQLEMEGSIG